MDTQIHTMKTDDVSKNSPASQSAGRIDALISDAVDRLKAELDLKFSVMLDNAEESFSNLPETPEHDDDPEDESDDDSHDKTSYFTKLVRILHSERDSVEKAFFKEITENNNSGQNRAQSDDLALSNKLSLVDQDEMDEMVAVTAMYSNAMTRYEDEVNNLLARIEYLEILSNRKLPAHMFDPRHICESFQAAIKQVEISIDYKLLLFKLFDQEVSSQLGDLYKSLNQLFIEAGVSPEVVYTVKNHDLESHSNAADSPRDSSSPNGQGSQADHADPGRGDSNTQTNTLSNNNAGSNDEISRFINQFMSGFSTAKGEGIPQSFSTTPTDADSQICYSRNDLMTALSKLQNNLAEVDLKNVSANDAEHIKRAIIANMGRSNGGAVTKTVHTLDQRCIDFVGMIFLAIADDESISMVITNLLMLLQIPIIKTAMLDEELFTQTNHPARITLDLITKAGRGVTEDTDRIFIELKDIVDGILQDHDNDNSSFEKAVEDLQTLIKKEEEISAENERIEQHEIIKQHAREQVLSEMRRVTNNKVVPANTRPLMLKHWPSLMFNHYINHGIESSEWILSLKIFNHLMQYLQPVKSKSQWQKLKDNHESLVETVKQELYRTRQDKEKINAQISQLEQTFLKILETNIFEPEEDQDTTQPRQASSADSYDETGLPANDNEECNDIELDDKAARIEEQVRIAREKISRLPSNLQPGVWFEVFNGEDKPIRRLKLSVILTEAAKLVFVDRQGVKVIEKDADDFLHELNNKQSRLIADHSTFEHALGTVIHKFAA